MSNFKIIAEMDAPFVFITTFTTVEFKKLLFMKLTSEIINILNAGGSVKINCKSKLTSELINIAMAASKNNVTLICTNAGCKLTSELINIAAGKGHVVFELD